MAGRNKGYEGITYNGTKGVFLLATEKDPSFIFELDQTWHSNNEIDFKGLGDVSAITFYDGKIYVLSDESHQLWMCDALTYKPIRKFYLPIINPEGVAFDKSGNLYIVSDDRAILYHFGPLTATN
jgi:uncharacterized protein YjiK